MGTQLLVEMELSLMRESVLHQQSRSLWNHCLLRKEHRGLSLAELDSLFLQHQLREAFTRADVALSVVGSIHIRREILEQPHAVGIVSE